MPKRKACVDSKASGCGVKKKRLQCYVERYTETYPCILPGRDQHRVRCTVCGSDFGIGTGGIDDIKTHIQGPWHKGNADKMEKQKKEQLENKRIDGFFPSQTVSTEPSTHQMDVIKAEVKLVDLVVELNLPMSASDKFSKGLPAMFHDSKIAKDLGCSRSKGTAIVKEMAAKSTLSLADRMKHHPFTISTDGSNDKGDTKLFPLIVRTVNPDTKEVRSEAISVPSIKGSATGAKIFGLIEAEMDAHKIPWDNCLALGCDNANVMVGNDTGVYGCMLKKHKQLFLSGCVCHLIHIAAEKGAECLPFNISQALVDVYYYLDKSTKRQAALKCHQLLHEIEETKMLKHVSTRWLSIGKCLPRLIDSFDALYDFFKEEEKTATKSLTKKKAEELKNIFASRTNKLYAKFLLYAISPFEKINSELQSDQPLIPVLKNKLEKLIRGLFIHFVKPSAMTYKVVLDVDFMSKINIKVKQDLIIGDAARDFVEHEKHLKPDRVEEFYTNVVKFYQASCSYLTKKLPVSDPVLKHAQVASPAKQLESTFMDVQYFLKRFPKMIGPAVSTTDVQLEFAKYQTTDIKACLQERMDETWKKVGELQEDGNPMFPHLSMVMLYILTIPHSSAHCERIFSIVRKNRTDFRGNMSDNTLEALVVCKSRPGCALERKYSKDDLKDYKSCYYRSLQPAKK